MFDETGKLIGRKKKIWEMYSIETLSLRERIAQRNNQSLKEDIHSRSPFIFSTSGKNYKWVLDGENIIIPTVHFQNWKGYGIRAGKYIKH